MADLRRSNRTGAPRPSWSRPKDPGAVERPPALRTLLRGLAKRCPNCGSGHLFRRYFTMVERCPRCGLRFHRQEGQWSGDIGANTIVTFSLLWAVLLGGTLLTWDDPNLVLLGAMALAIVVLFPALFVPHAKTLWVAIDIIMRPVEPHELETTAPTSTEPAPTKPTPTEPASTTPTPTEPVSTAPASTTPTPTDPVSTAPAHHEPSR